MISVGATVPVQHSKIRFMEMAHIVVYVCGKIVMGNVVKITAEDFGQKIQPYVARISCKSVKVFASSTGLSCRHRSMRGNRKATPDLWRVLD